MEKVDAIIIANNQEERHYQLTHETIRTLKASMKGHDLRIFLVESNPEAKEVFSDCEVIKPNEKFNLANFSNLVYQRGVGDWVLVLNNDLEFTPNWWEEILKAYQKNQSVKSFSPFEPNFHGTYYRDWFQGDDNLYFGYEVPGRVTGWCIVHRREILEKIGQFDSRFNFYFIDNDYGRRLQYHGIPHTLVKSSIVYHKLSQSHTTNPSLSGQGGMDLSKSVFEEKWKFQEREVKPKIKLVHLLLNPNEKKDLSDEMWDSRISKQNQSIECWRRIAHKFNTYTETYSVINREELPVETCADPGIINTSKEFNNTPPVLSYGHYGAYRAHRSAILNEFSSDVDALLIVEGDVLFKSDPDEFYEEVEKAVKFSFANNGSLFTFGKVNYGVASLASKMDTCVDFGKYKKIDHFLCAHCYMVFRNEKDTIQQKLLSTGWHAWDIWLYWNYDRRVPIFSTKEPIVYEPEGVSMIDYNNKNTEL